MGLADAIFGGAGGPRRDDKIVNAIAIDIARTRHCSTGTVEIGVADDGEAIARRKTRQIDRGTRRSSLPEDDIGRAGVRAARITENRADDDVVESVAIDIARARDAEPGKIARDIALNDEAIARGKTGQIDIGPRRPGLPEDDIGFTRIAAAIVAIGRADDQIVDAVAIDVARAGDAERQPVVGIVAADNEPLT